MKITIIGSGTWGTALAKILADNNHTVLMYGRNEKQVREINDFHTNSSCFNNLILNDRIKATTDIEAAVDGSEIIVLAVPTVAVRDILITIEKIITNRPVIINGSKGFDPKMNMRISEVIREIIPSTKRAEVVSIFGPGHAEEVVRELLTAVCIVSIDEDLAIQMQKVFANDYFRVYTLVDEIGAEYAAAYKNVIAIASGVISGMGYGDNTRAALITRALAEMIRFGKTKGGKLETFLGLTGIGDLIVTSTSLNSRNYQFGYAIGQTLNAEQILKSNKKTVEGARSAKSIYEFANEIGLKIPICASVYDVLYRGKDVKQAIDNLMSRDLINEDEW